MICNTFNFSLISISRAHWILWKHGHFGGVAIVSFSWREQIFRKSHLACGTQQREPRPCLIVQQSVVETAAVLASDQVFSSKRGSTSPAQALMCTPPITVSPPLVRFVCDYSGSLQENLYRCHQNCWIILSYGAVLGTWQRYSRRWSTPQHHEHHSSLFSKSLSNLVLSSPLCGCL